MTGEILWDAPEIAGEYAIAYQIEQWRKVGGSWKQVGAIEVILIDRIEDANQDIFIEAPKVECFTNPSQTLAEFNITAPNDRNLTVEIFSDLPSGHVNAMDIVLNELMEFNFSGDQVVSINIPQSLPLEPFKPYRVILQIETEHFTETASWAFVFNCDSLPGRISPPANVEEEGCQAFTIYPNPSFSKQINVCIPESIDQARHISIADMSGKIYYEDYAALSKKSFSLEMVDLSPGVYLLQVDQYAGKFIIGF